jgi:DnaJ-class molecular chaperone
MESEQQFAEINEAYGVLNDADKRGAYDRYGHAAFEPGVPGSVPILPRHSRMFSMICLA